MVIAAPLRTKVQIGLQIGPLQIRNAPLLQRATSLSDTDLSQLTESILAPLTSVEGDYQPCNRRSIFADFGGREIDMGAYSLLLRAEQRETTREKAAQMPRGIVLFDLSYLAKP
jgi:hypothetical protein